MKKSPIIIGLLFLTIFCTSLMAFLPLTPLIEQKQTIETTNPEKSSLPTPYIHYEFNNFSDSMSHSPDGVPTGNAYIVSNGIRGSGLFVQSETNELTIPHVDGLISLNEFTIQFWFKQYEQHTITQNLIQKGDMLSQSTFAIFRYPYDTYNTADVIAGHGNEFGNWIQVSNPNCLSFGQWHLVTYVKGMNWHGYWIDGKWVYNSSITANVFNSSDPIRIGVNAINLYFDELMIWNSVLPEPNIEEYYKEFFPIAYFSSDKSDVILGESVQFYDGTTGGYFPYTYSWMFDDGTYSSEPNPSHTFTQTGKEIFYVNLTITDMLGNTSTFTKEIFVINNVGTFWISSQNGDYSPDGRIRLNWTIAENASYYEIYQNNVYIATRNANENWFEIIKTNPGVYEYYVKAVGVSGSRMSNIVSITTDTFPGAFSLWTYGTENPDQDGIFTLQWGESLNVAYFEVYEGNRLIHTTSGPRELKVTVNESRVYEYYVKAKNSRGFFDSNRISVTVSLNQNQTNSDPKNPNGAGGDSTDNLMKFLQENAPIIAGSTAGAMALAVIFKVLKGGKGKIKIKLPKAPFGDSITPNDDFFDSEL